MSEVVQELQLVNIVEVAQDRLVRNFTLILRRLNSHDAQFAQQQTQTQRFQQENRLALSRVQQVLSEQQQAINERVEQLAKRILLLEEGQTGLRGQLGQCGSSLRGLSTELFNTQLQFQQKVNTQQQQLSQICRNIQILSNEQQRMVQEINKKENKVENERLVKDTEILKDKNEHLESELKMAHHKIEKIEILNEKAERMQAKKEIDILKEIEDRVRKQIKVTINEIAAPVAGQAVAKSNEAAGLRGSAYGSRQAYSNVPGLLRTSSVVQGSQMSEKQNVNSAPIYSSGVSQLLDSGSVQGMLQKWGDKIKYLQVQVKEVLQNLKVLNKNVTGKRTEHKDTASEGIKEKINEIKPEIVKLWAKVDTFEDRLSFGERKLQEKTRGFSELAAMIKDNSASRIEEKLKNLQTQIYTSLKEVRGKIEGKVNIPDFEKYCQSVKEQLLQTNEAIYLKSDKLQVKKALLFLESKIKEIILVISEDEENEKDALLTKKQLKCISCDKELERFSGVVSSPKGNWDCLPYKEHPSEVLGRFGMTNFGSLAKKIKKLEGKDLPLLNKRNVNQSFQASS